MDFLVTTGLKEFLLKNIQFAIVILAWLCNRPKFCNLFALMHPFCVLIILVQSCILWAYSFIFYRKDRKPMH